MMTPYVIEIVRNKKDPVVRVERPVEIVEDEVARKPETGTPEWIGDPAIQVVVVGRR